MKILFVCPQNPFITYSGAHQRTYLLLSAMVEAGLDVDVIYIDKKDPNEDECLKSKVRILATFNYRSTRFDEICYKLRYLIGFGLKLKRKSLNDVISYAVSSNQYDYVFARYIDIVQEANLQSFSNLIVDIDDSPYEVYKVRYNNEKNRLLKLWYRIASIRASKYMRRYEATFKVAFYPQSKQCLLANSVYLPNIPFAKPCDYPDTALKSKYFLYVGVLSWMPNYLGLDSFIDNVWPRIITQHPDMQLIIVGKGLSNQLSSKWGAVQGVKLLGFVDDLSKIYKEARAIVVPIYQGGGTNIKVLEALKYGKALVVTPHATRGFDEVLRNRENVLIADSDKQFGDYLIELIESDDLVKRLSAIGPQIIQNHFSEETFYRIIKSTFAKL